MKYELDITYTDFVAGTYNILLKIDDQDVSSDIIDLLKEYREKYDRFYKEVYNNNED